MQKTNIKLLTAIMAVALITIAGIFHACNKEDVVNTFQYVAEKSLKKEKEFVTKNYDGTCVRVSLCRDANDNAQFTIENVDHDPEQTIGLMVSEELDLKTLTEDGKYTLEIPNDGIYWLVPLDGNKPVKFDPVNDEKARPGDSGRVDLLCPCWEWSSDCGLTTCDVKISEEGKRYCVARDCCKDCKSRTNVLKGSIEMIFIGSTYLVKSNTIVVNGITYK